MRIALRTSGGRGEYEIAGSHCGTSVSDVIDHEILLQMLPNNIIRSNNWVRRSQGKPRIRLKDSTKDSHIYLIISNILLMPKPKRELGITPIGKLQLTENNYCVTSIQFDLVNIGSSSLVIQPSDLILSNSEFDLARIDILERMRILLDIWAKASTRQDELSTLLLQHRDGVLSGDLVALQALSKKIRAMFGIEDPLREILRNYSLLDEYTYWLGIHRNDVEASIIEENTIPIQETTKEHVRQWRLQASRGSQGAKFSREVKMAYQNRCLFTGYHLPKSSICNTSGVDSAHILPWAAYGINEIQNGICLSKLCHWAFDNGILVLRYIKERSYYELSVSAGALDAERNGMISLEAFKSLQGVIPNERLPENRSEWPSSNYLEEYNNFFS
jgi:HNH endonuclease